MRRINQAYLLFVFSRLLIRFCFHEYSLQVPIANAKLQLLQKFTWKNIVLRLRKKSIQSECKDHKMLAIYTKLPVLHEIEGIEDIKVLFLGKHLNRKHSNDKLKQWKKWHQDVLKIDYQSVSHEVDPWSSSGHVVEWVSRLRRKHQTEVRSNLDCHNISGLIIIHFTLIDEWVGWFITVDGRV